MDIKTVKADLEEIKYYYENQQELDIAAKCIGECAIATKLKRYNDAITHAPIKLYRLYMALYVNGSTQLEYALELDRCVDRVYKTNKKLCQYFADYFSEVGTD